MTAGDAEVLARLRLVEGRSDTELREFVRSHSQALLMVGTDRQCNWCIQGADVAPVHFSLHWDGSSLRIADTHGAGKVRVDGTTLVGSEWRRLSGRTRIEFGRAAIVVEASSESSEADFRRQRARRGTLPELNNDVSPRGGAASLGLDQRTFQGYAPIKVAGNVRGVAEPSQPLPVRATRHTMEYADEGLAPTSLQLTNEPAAAMVVHRRDEPQPQAPLTAPKPGNAQASAGQDERIPKVVLVLSPVSSSADQPDVTTRHSSGPPRATRTLPGWGTLTLSLVALTTGYLVWLYLLYNL